MNEYLKNHIAALITYVEFHSEDDLHALRTKIAKKRAKRTRLERAVKKLNEEIDCLNTELETAETVHTSRLTVTQKVLSEINAIT